MAWFTKDRDNEGNRPGPQIRVTAESLIRQAIKDGQVSEANYYRILAAARDSRDPDDKQRAKIFRSACNSGAVRIIG